MKTETTDVPDVAVGVIIPTFRRPKRLMETLSRIAACRPRPAEVIVHIDAGDTETAVALTAATMPMRVLQAEKPAGAGGGRNRLMQAATQEIVVSLDDDSYPIDEAFFSQALALMNAHPEYALIAVRTIPPGEEAGTIGTTTKEGFAFEGCGAIFRRSALAAMEGYVPLRYSYGMEETDIALQLIDAGYRIGQTDQLRVRHDLQVSLHGHPDSNAAQIVNTGLLPFLRFPWPYVLALPLRVCRRAWYCLCAGRFRGTARGILLTPLTLWRYRGLRRPVRRSTMLRYLQIRGSSEPGR